MDQHMRGHTLQYRADKSAAQTETVHQRDIALPLQQSGLQARQIGFKEGDPDSRVLAFEGLKNRREARRAPGAKRRPLSAPRPGSSQAPGPTRTGSPRVRAVP